MTLSIHLGSCADVLKAFPSASIDLVVTDPPYLCRYRDRDNRTVANDNQSDWLLPSFREISRVMKPNTFCVAFYGWQHVEKFMLAWKQCGLKPVGHLVWPKGYSSRSDYLAAKHEQAFLLAKGHPPKPDRPLSDVQRWIYTGNTLHPTQKAVEIIEPLIASFSKPGDTVLDPFMGSGTTGIAAAKTGRHFVGIELTEGHFQTVARRFGMIEAEAIATAA